jgi:Spy/CpxP family protein refolding chaperone
VSAAKTTTIAVVVVVLTFAAGVAVGIFTAHLMILRGTHGPMLMPPTAMVHRLDRRLDLTDAQRAQVEQIIRRRHARIESMWREMRPRVREEIEQTNAEISRILTLDQRRRFEKLKLHLGPPPPREHPRDRARTESTR